ncbi:MAG: 4Fe-4S dicluster domain-containing protein [Planctomycetia bacterium]|nr:4Fe-4S dicluster domain-containing protein [Planctomycetia bacterium]
MSQIITLEQLKSLVDSLIKDGAKVAAPVVAENGRSFYQYLDDSSSMLLNGFNKSFNSIKEFFFPKHEVLYQFVRQENDVLLTDAVPFETSQYIFGARPCEAAALPILDPLFAWDYQDRFYQQRREKTTVISMACLESDSHCFCSAVGGSPENPNGSDVMLYDLGDGSFEVRCLTEKGKQLFNGKTNASDKTGTACSPPIKTFDIEKIQLWLKDKDHFNDPFWEEASLRCVGCGICTFVCPTCHCFDIVDEGSFKKGERVKNWDSCQSALFTLHASGHNPRSTQGQRQRQRITHKFSIYPDKFGVLLCSGCGNCSRHCSAALGVKPFLKTIEER